MVNLEQFDSEFLVLRVKKIIKITAYTIVEIASRVTNIGELCNKYFDLKGGGISPFYSSKENSLPIEF